MDMKRFIAAALLFAVAAGPAPAAALDLSATDEVIGLSLSGMQRAYPLALFAATPVVNDELGNLVVVVFYDPATDMAGAFFRLVAGEPLEFSGQAAGTVADDLTTSTRWDLATGEAVSGSLAGMKLIPIPTLRGPYSGWMSAHPKSTVYNP